MDSQPTPDLRRPCAPAPWTNPPASLGAASSQLPRSETRERRVHRLEYSHYPRRARQQRRLVGLTRDESKSGLCVVVDQSEPEGSLLQIRLHTLSGEIGRQALAKVVWCRSREDGRSCLGLCLVAHGERRGGDFREAADSPREAFRSMRVQD